jgi:hypothetical protein
LATLSDSQSIADRGAFAVPSWAKAADAVPASNRAISPPLIDIKLDRFISHFPLRGQITHIGKAHEADKPQQNKEKQCFDQTPHECCPDDLLRIVCDFL